jgi:hypothetical protein
MESPIWFDIKWFISRRTLLYVSMLHWLDPKRLPPGHYVSHSKCWWTCSWPSTTIKKTTSLLDGYSWKAEQLQVGWLVGYILHHQLAQHNITQIHNNVLWDWQYFATYFSHLDWMWGIFFKLLSILRNTIMDLNNIINWFNIKLILPLEANLPCVIVALVGTYTLPRGQHISTVQALNKFMTLYKSIESLAAAMKAVASLHLPT